MKLKEISKPKSAAGHTEVKAVSPAAALFLSAVSGFLAAGTRLGGNGAPLCAAIAAVLPSFDGAAAFVGAMSAFFLNGTMSSSITEMIAMPAVILSKAALASVLGKKVAPAVSGVLAAAAYVICGTIAAFFFKITAALIMAIVFRGIICGGAAYFISKLFLYVKSGGGSVVGIEASAAAVYVLGLCMLCGLSFGTFNAGRIAGCFAIAAAAFRYGAAGGAVVGALSVFAFGMVSPSSYPTAAIVVCSGVASGFFSPKSKLVSAAVFIGVCFAGSLIYGMPSDSVKLLADVTAASAAFYIIPERLFRKSFVRKTAPRSAALGRCGNSLKFAAEAVSDVRSSFSKAAEVLDKNEYENDISASVCRRVCRSCRSSAFCAENEERRISDYFRPAEKILKENGFISEKNLCGALEHCPQKAELVKAFNEAYRLCLMEKRFDDASFFMRELTIEQLSGTEDMLKYFGSFAERFPFCDETLSEYTRGFLEEYGAKNVSAAVLFDRDGRLFIECFYEGLLSEKLEKLTERLCEISDRELDKPAATSINGITRLRYHEIPIFEAEIGRACANGKERTSGDSDAVFNDGLGNVIILISDGMGSGVRAAVESRMTVSVIARLIRAGIGADAAVRLVNQLLLTKSSEEIFATIDLLKINLFNGKAEVIKLGAAQTFFKTNGTVKTVEGWSTPVGIIGNSEISRRSVSFSDGDEAVMITDGITEDCFSRIRELMLSPGITAQDCSERIVAEAEKGKENSLSRQDDKTVFVVKIHKV